MYLNFQTNLMNMKNPIPIKWSRLWVLSLALCFFGSVEMGFAQKATYQTKDGKTAQKAENATIEKQKKLKEQKPQVKKMFLDRTQVHLLCRGNCDCACL